MAVAKVILNGNTLIDVTDKTVTSSNLVSPNTALGADGTTVTGALVTKSASDVTVSGATTTIPAGVYSSQVQKTVSNGSATTPATTITANPTISVSSNGLITASVSASKSVTPTVSAGYVSSGTVGTVSVSGSNTSQLTTQAAQTITPTTTNQTISSGRYLTGNQTILGDTNLVASNIMSGVSIFGVTGTLEPGGNLDSIAINTSKFTSQSTTIEDGLVDVEDFSGQTMANGSIFKSFFLMNNFINFSIPNKYKFIGTINIQWANGDIETYTINSDYINITQTTIDYPISFTWSSSNHSQTFTGVRIRYSNSSEMSIRFYYTTAPTESPIAISPSTLSVYYETEGYESVTINLADDPRFLNIYKSLANRQCLSHNAPYVSEWCNSLSSILSEQFMGQPFSGSIVFSNVSYVGEYAFAYAYNSFMTGFGGTVYPYTLSFPSLTSLTANGIFAFNRGLRNIYCPSVTILGPTTFFNCFSLSAVSFPKCTEIKNSTFMSCSQLETVYFPSCSRIGINNFYGCSSLTTASFPECTYIDYAAFCSCSKLINISFPKCVTINWYAFQNCYSLSNAEFPSCTTIGNYAFSSCVNLITASFSNCQTISSNVFYTCASLTTAFFPECTAIGNWAFYTCLKLSDINFSKCITIGSSAFGCCYSLTTASFPECTTIGSGAFISCSSLTTTSFPKCQIIEYTAFVSCHSLTTISFPKATSVGRQAFFNCYSLSSIYFMGSSIPTLSTQAFTNTPIAYSSYLGYFGSIYVPTSLLASYKTATNWTNYSARMVGI